MIQGLYAAASGMLGIERRQDVVANNIANAATPGFRRQVAVNEGFNEILLRSMRHPFRLDAERAPGGGQNPRRCAACSSAVSSKRIPPRIISERGGVQASLPSHLIARVVRPV